MANLLVVFIWLMAAFASSTASHLQLNSAAASCPAVHCQDAGVQGLLSLADESALFHSSMLLKRRLAASGPCTSCARGKDRRNPAEEDYPDQNPAEEDEDEEPHPLNRRTEEFPLLPDLPQRVEESQQPPQRAERIEGSEQSNQRRAEEVQQQVEQSSKSSPPGLRFRPHHRSISSSSSGSPPGPGGFSGFNAAAGHQQVKSDQQLQRQVEKSSDLHHSSMSLLNRRLDASGPGQSCCRGNRDRQNPAEEGEEDSHPLKHELHQLQVGVAQQQAEVAQLVNQRRVRQLHQQVEESRELHQRQMEEAKQRRAKKKHGVVGRWRSVAASAASTEVPIRSDFTDRHMLRALQ